MLGKKSQAFNILVPFFGVNENWFLRELEIWGIAHAQRVHPTLLYSGKGKRFQWVKLFQWDKVMWWESMTMVMKPLRYIRAQEHWTDGG